MHIYKYVSGTECYITNQIYSCRDNKDECFTFTCMRGKWCACQGGHLWHVLKNCLPETAQAHKLDVSRMPNLFCTSAIQKLHYSLKSTSSHFIKILNFAFHFQHCAHVFKTFKCTSTSHVIVVAINITSCTPVARHLVITQASKCIVDVIIFHSLLACRERYHLLLCLTFPHHFWGG